MWRSLCIIYSIYCIHHCERSELSFHFEWTKCVVKFWYCGKLNFSTLWEWDPKRHFLLSIVCRQSFPSCTPYHLLMTSSANWHTAKHQKMKGTKKLQNLLRVFSVCTKKQKEIKIIHHWNPFSHIVWQITNTQYFKRLCKIDNFKTNRICGANWKLTEMTSRQVYDRSLSRKFFENQKFQMTPKLPSENCTYYTLFQKSIFRQII